VRAALTVLLFLTGARAAHAHGRSISYSTWDLDPDGATVEARFSALDLSLLRLPAAAGVDPVARYAADHLVLERDGRACPLAAAPSELPAPDGWRVFSWRVSCPSGSRVVRSDLLLAEAPSHLHFARLRRSDGTLAERVLGEGDPGWAVDQGTGVLAPASSLLGFVALGSLHVLTGWDHLAFVLALLLLVRTLRDVVLVVSAFALAHSITLVLAALGALHAAPAPVAALLGFSVALVAAQDARALTGKDRLVAPLGIALLAGMALVAARGSVALQPLALLGLAGFSVCWFALLDRTPRPTPLRVALAFAFGLLHGLAFAGELGQTALPSSGVVPALIGFNVGIELALLVLLAALWALFYLLRRSDGRYERTVLEVGSAALCGLGLFWFLTRALR
jgi:hypothetical protein